VIAMPENPDQTANATIPMPRLSDHAVVHIHDFIGHFLDLFEARYGDQIHRYYEDRSAPDMIDPEPTYSMDDPPF
jgi:hypothetical protein